MQLPVVSEKLGEVVWVGACIMGIGRAAVLPGLQGTPSDLAF